MCLVAIFAGGRRGGGSFCDFLFASWEEVVLFK